MTLSLRLPNAERVLSLSGPLTAYVPIVCILEYELDLNGTGQDSHVANLSVQKPVPPCLDCRDEDEGEDLSLIHI